MLRTSFVVACALFLTACSAQQQAQRTPLLYPNSTLERKTQAQVQMDIEECDAKARQYVKPLSTGTQVKRVGLAALESAVVGTAAGAVGGTIFGKAGRGAGAGAAVGGMTGAYGAVKELMQVDPREREFIKSCLEEKGYKLMGWQSDEE